MSEKVCSTCAYRDDCTMNWVPGCIHYHKDELLPECSMCGELMTPAGTCFRCPNCGETSGCE